MGRIAIGLVWLESRLVVPKVRLVFVSVYGFVLAPAVWSLPVRAPEPVVASRLGRGPTRSWAS